MVCSTCMTLHLRILLVTKQPVLQSKNFGVNAWGAMVRLELRNCYKPCCRWFSNAKSSTFVSCSLCSFGKLIKRNSHSHKCQTCKLYRDCSKRCMRTYRRSIKRGFARLSSIQIPGVQEDRSLSHQC